MSGLSKFLKDMLHTPSDSVYWPEIPKAKKEWNGANSDPGAAEVQRKNPWFKTNAPVTRTYIRTLPNGKQAILHTTATYERVTEKEQMIKVDAPHVAEDFSCYQPAFTTEQAKTLVTETFGPLEKLQTPETAHMPNTEHDPHGTDPHAAGAKLDGGKLRAGLVLDDFALALTAVAAVGTLGAAKYTPHGWLSVPDGMNRYTDAQRRHELALAAGEDDDPDTQLPHLAHAAWNALARLQFALQADRVNFHELQAITQASVAAINKTETHSKQKPETQTHD